MEKHYFEDRFEISPNYDYSDEDEIHSYYKVEDVEQQLKARDELIEEAITEIEWFSTFVIESTLSVKAVSHISSVTIQLVESLQKSLKGE